MNQPVSLSRFHTLLHPYVTSLVTCCGADGKPNIIAVAWLVPVSVQPPLVGMSIRPTRYSYELIQATGEFVINVAPFEIAGQALYCGRHSGRDVDKFAATRLTPGPAQLVRPPIIQECLAHLECRVVNDLPAGDHRFVIAEVLATSVRPGVLGDDELYDLASAHPLLHLGRNEFATAACRGTEHLPQD
jgi:flavin reductase (DIM6/NTAB) family NADH-FMN oxidoreductase RutF